MLVPAGLEQHEFPDVEPAVKAFYEYHHACDDRAVGWPRGARRSAMASHRSAVSLDRNGLRPCALQDHRCRRHGGGRRIRSGHRRLPESARSWWRRRKLQPGKMFLVDTRSKVASCDDMAELKINARWPTRRTVPPSGSRSAMRHRTDSPADGQRHRVRSRSPCSTRQQAFGYTHEDLKFVLDRRWPAQGRRPDMVRWVTTRRSRC